MGYWGEYNVAVSPVSPNLSTKKVKISYKGADHLPRLKIIQQTPFESPVTLSGNSQLPVIPAPGALMSFSGLPRHLHTYNIHSDRHA